ncbi:MAG: tetratricopeptide repeat protein, partial [Proteobacteria bacterium]
MKPGDGPCLGALRSLFMRGDIPAAIAACNTALAANPDDVRVLEILGLSLARQRSNAEALAVLERAYRLAPEDPQLSYNLGVTLQNTGDTRRAMLRYRDCLRALPDHADTLWNYGELLRVSDRFDLAARCFETLLKKDDTRPDIYHRLGVCLAHLGRDEDADEAFRKALGGNSSDPALTHWEYAHFLLARGDFGRGWPHYDFRFDCGEKTSVSCHSYPYPAWRGEPLEGKTLLVHGEQGLGDEIMFCSVVPELAAEAKRIVVACQPPLVRLFADSFPACDVLPHRVFKAPAQAEQIAHIDFAVSMGSLCRYRRERLDPFESSANGYLGA